MNLLGSSCYFGMEFIVYNLPHPRWPFDSYGLVLVTLLARCLLFDITIVK